MQQLESLCIHRNLNIYFTIEVTTLAPGSTQNFLSNPLYELILLLVHKALNGLASGTSQTCLTQTDLQDISCCPVLWEELSADLK